jgi:hypothetical protein
MLSVADIIERRTAGDQCRVNSKRHGRMWPCITAFSFEEQTVTSVRLIYLWAEIRALGFRKRSTCSENWNLENFMHTN